MFFPGFAAAPTAAHAVQPLLASRQLSRSKSKPARLRRLSIGGDQGGALVEMALVMPIMLAMLTSIFSLVIGMERVFHLDEMEDPEELRALPSWKVHILTGDRKGTWSLSVTANRRLTFRIDTSEREIYDANLEDYH